MYIVTKYIAGYLVDDIYIFGVYDDILKCVKEINQYIIDNFDFENDEVKTEFYPFKENLIYSFHKNKLNILSDYLMYFEIHYYKDKKEQK